MAKRSTPPHKIPVDPLFAIPDGAEDQFIYTRESFDDADPENLSAADFETIEEYQSDYDDGYDDQEQIILETPNDFVVFSQVLRRAPGGQQVVDVVIECQDIDGATNYEIQVTKV